MVKSNKWMVTTFTVLFLMVIFTDETLNIWNIIGIGTLGVAGVLNILRTKRTVYIFSDRQIWNISENRKIVNSEMIEKTDFGTDEIRIDTSKYINHLVIKRNELLKPDWAKLLTNMEQLEKTWANKGEQS